jgi:hypothetical protein
MAKTELEVGCVSRYKMRSYRNNTSNTETKHILLLFASQFLILTERIQ